MDVIALGCAVAETRGFSGLMRAASAIGNGAFVGGLATALLLPALGARRHRLARLALAALVAVLVAGIAANVLKLIVDSARPHLGHPTPGFPSGHTAIAFAAAMVLARAVPAAAPLFLLVAMFTGVARLYFEAHYAVDVVGGALLGIGVGWFVSNRAPIPREPGAWTRRWLWTVPLAFASLAVLFFVAYEHAVASQRAEDALTRGGRVDVRIPFGEPETRALLRDGWSVDERWDARMPFVWAVGSTATMRLPALPAVDHDVRLRLAPFVRHDGLSCQQAEVSVNGWSAGRLVLARGWRNYVVTVPGWALDTDEAELQFRFAYTARPGKHDQRPLSVAFTLMEVRQRP